MRVFHFLFLLLTYIGNADPRDFMWGDGRVGADEDGSDFIGLAAVINAEFVTNDRVWLAVVISFFN